jgi:hypothetical protein
MVCVKKIYYLIGMLLLMQNCSKPRTATSPAVVIRSGLVMPFENFDFSKGQWKAVLAIDEADFQTLDARVQHKKNLVCENITILKEMQNSWKFKMTDGDLATVTSFFTLEQNGVNVFSAGIVLSAGSGGLQSEKLGWAPVTNQEAFYNIIGKFSAGY